ncbi:uncharacterized protein LOC133175640 [Saccostrea echinata]|uniref:uncharacterized protein LOC133175640 n=1 Tax=Saccostrea echinata TaxID=191078 RepID=UPI002A8063F7|nr:uncharacterized protein LOC133175640 [Saccostrea echinata]
MDLQQQGNTEAKETKYFYDECVYFQSPEPSSICTGSEIHPSSHPTDETLLNATVIYVRDDIDQAKPEETSAVLSINQPKRSQGILFFSSNPDQIMEQGGNTETQGTKTREFYSPESSTMCTGSEIHRSSHPVNKTLLNQTVIYVRDENDREEASADFSINQQTNSTEISTFCSNLNPISERRECTRNKYKSYAVKPQSLPFRQDCLKEGSISGKASFCNLYSNGRGSTAVNTGKPIIYLTFSDKSKRHTREIMKLCEELGDSLDFSVKCDSFYALRKTGELNLHGWRDINYEKAKWILFCISPDYRNALKAGECSSTVTKINEREQGIINVHNIARVVNMF